MKKCTQKKPLHLNLNITREEDWANYNKKEKRTYYSLNQNWKKKLESLSSEEKTRLLFKYALDGNKKVVKSICQAGGEPVDLTYFDKDHNNALMFAVKSGDEATLTYLLEMDIETDYINNLGFSPLHLAVRKNSMELTRKLLEHDATLDFEDAYYQTPLFEAVMENNTHMIRTLVYLGSDINHKNREGRTPLMIASFNKKRQEAMNMLIALGADINARDNQGRTALMHAINNDNGAMIDILLHHDANMRVKDKDGTDCIMLCAKRGNREALRVLLARGLSPFGKDKHGKTAIDIAKHYTNHECVQIIEKAQRIYLSNLTNEEKVKALKEFATHNRVINSCIR